MIRNSIHNFVCRYADEGHLAREWGDMTRDIKNIRSAAPRAATYVNKLKVRGIQYILYIFKSCYTSQILILYVG